MNKLLSLFHRSHRPNAGALSSYLDGALSPSRTASLEGHLATCATCRSRVAEIREVRSSLAALPEVEAPRSFRLQPSQVVRDRQPASARSFVYAVPALGAAAVVALTVLVAVDVRGGGSGRTGDGRTAFTAQQAAENASGVAGTAAAASSGDRAAGAFAPSPEVGKSFDQNTVGASPVAPNAAAPPAVVAPTSTASSPQPVLSDSSVANAASATARSEFSASNPAPTGTIEPLTVGQATSASGTPAAVVTREQPSESSGGGIGALRIGEIIAGVVIVVMGGLTVRIFRARRGVSE